MTTANKITLTRIAMIPFFIYFAAQPMLIIDRGNYIVSFPTCTVIALVLFCVASFTDFLDGYVARKYNQASLSIRSRTSCSSPPRSSCSLSRRPWQAGWCASSSRAS